VEEVADEQWEVVDTEEDVVEDEELLSSAWK
jgi:hypothetical protein